MAKSSEELPFQELIQKLNKVKNINAVSTDLIDDLLNAGIAGAVYITKQKNKVSGIEAIELARMLVLKHFDEIILDTRENGEFVD